MAEKYKIYDGSDSPEVVKSYQASHGLTSEREQMRRASHEKSKSSMLRFEYKLEIEEEMGATDPSMSALNTSMQNQKKKSK